MRTTSARFGPCIISAEKDVAKCRLPRTKPGNQCGRVHDGYSKLHPCVTPPDEAREVVKRFTLPDKLVVDPFCGTGTIPLACKLEEIPGSSPRIDARELWPRRLG